MKAETKKIIEMVEKGMTAKEIREELGIKARDRATLRRIYYKALVEAGKIEDILTEREVKEAPQRRPLTVGKRGTILLSKALVVEQLGFKERDKFTVGKRKDSIILKKTE
jgi:hypothetical protein